MDLARSRRAPLALYAVLVQRCAGWFDRHRPLAWIVLLPLGALVWALVHASGLHATIAGVLLAFAVPVAARDRRRGVGDVAERIDLAESFGYRFGPLSSGIAVPVFAFFAAGVPISGAAGFATDPVAIGVVLGLLVGKPLGIGLSVWILTRLTGTVLGGDRRERFGVFCLAGIGFTVSLLIADLSFAGPEADVARLAVMVGSLASAVAAAAFLLRGPRARRSAR
ncbi:Na+/H+ antiporter NhaA [Leucobacter soli]|uniref:Na+/H+ antiporter NhaA n=1 Tax=Leucobacter soli TaxID=2812850 RepID=UPI003616BF81